MSEADSLQAGRNRAGECCPAVAGISVEQPHLPELFFDVSGFDVHDRSCEVFPQHQTMGPGVSPQLRKQCLDKGSALIGESYEPESLFPCQAASWILSPGGEVLNGTQRIKFKRHACSRIAQASAVKLFIHLLKIEIIDCQKLIVLAVVPPV